MGKIKFLYIGLLLSLIVGQFGSINIGPLANIYFHDLIIGILLSAWFGYAFFVRKSFFVPSLFFPMLIFLFWALITLIVGGVRISLDPNEFLISSLYLVRLVAYFGVFLISFDLVRNNREVVNVFFKVSLISVTVFSVIGLIQLVFFPNTEVFALTSGWDIHRGRLFSTFLDPNFAGAFMVANLILALLLLNFKTFSKIGRLYILTLATIVFVTPALSFTVSRSAWLFLFISSFVLGIFRSKIFWAFIIAFFLATFVFVPKSRERLMPFASFLTSQNQTIEERIDNVDASARARLGSWSRGIRLIRQYPVFGVGFNTLRYASSKSGFFGGDGGLGPRSGAGVDSSLLFVLTTTGVVGLIIFLIIGLKILKDSFLAIKKKYSETSHFLGLLVFSIFVGVFFESNFINSIFYPQILLWLVTMLGAFYATTEDPISISRFTDLKKVINAKLWWFGLSAKDRTGHGKQ